MSCPRLCLLPWCTNCTSLLHSAGNSWCPCLHRPVHTVRQEEQREFHTANPFLSEAMQVLQDCKAQHKAGLTASTQPTETLTIVKAVYGCRTAFKIQLEPCLARKINTEDHNLPCMQLHPVPYKLNRDKETIHVGIFIQSSSIALWSHWHQLYHLLEQNRCREESKAASTVQ